MTKCEYFFFIFVLLIKISVELGKKIPATFNVVVWLKGIRIDFGSAEPTADFFFLEGLIYFFIDLRLWVHGCHFYSTCKVMPKQYSRFRRTMKFAGL